MSYQVKKKPGKLKTQPMGNPYAVAQAPQQQQQASQQQAQNNTPEKSEVNPNEIYGMPSATEAEKNRTMTNEEYQRKLERDELIFGPIPLAPTQKAIDDIVFDYCDGIRLVVNKKKNESDPVTTYHVLIKDDLTDTIICNGLIDNADNRAIVSQQKYFAHFGLTITRRVPIPDEMRTDIKNHYHLTDIEIDKYFEYKEFIIDLRNLLLK